MSAPHQLGRNVKGLPLLWLAVLLVLAGGAFWYSVDSVLLAASVTRHLGQSAAALLMVCAVAYAAGGVVALYCAGRVARSCWRMYGPSRNVPPGCCRRCAYDLRGNVSGRCPECGASART